MDELLITKAVGGAPEAADARSSHLLLDNGDYFVEHAIPNFFFHLSQAYAILRHNGVGVGKRDYLGTLSQKLPV